MSTFPDRKPHPHKKLLYCSIQEFYTVCYRMLSKYRCTEAMQHAPSDAAVTA